MRQKLGSKRSGFVKPDGSLEYTDDEGARILMSHSKGDKRFSPLIAKLACGETIEVVYQKAKRDADGKPIAIRIGHDTEAAYLYCNGELLPFAAYKHEFWYMLWMTYFCENPELLTHAKGYAGFRDIFDGHGGEVFYSDDPDVFGRYATAQQNCAQSRAIAWAVVERPLHAKMDEGLRAYWQKYH